ncbi:ligand-gated channel protein [Salinivibrio kushneri]|uniref:ligand-gated channel protein n=1 Tax=Salinivibrio kushneri TaxID=1908198 RepID=UPI0009D039BA|nr:ligand-gated channel protein [Salinivibrio kushneri]OOE48974.1 ligand-gated channel protein [Salinivibrio kushneri]OOE49469.1 ligand-gated channel protein [Salinivibrio kushneri]OOE60146.1 ligand-gated channel protein [Salinivibrio kushneri]
MSSCLRPVVIGMVLAGIPVSAIHAAEAGDQNTETMVITASGFEQATAKAPASISVISRDQLEDRYYRDVTDALKRIPGVVVTGGGDTQDISIRGMGSKYTLMLVDGKRMTSRETRPNSDGPGIEQGWLPPLQAIERIEVIRGPMSTLYGSDAIGGVINIITRREQHEWHGNVQLSTLLQEKRASGDEQSANFYLSGALSDKLGMTVSGQNVQRQEDDILSGYEDKSLRSLSTSLTYDASDYQQWTLDLGASSQERNGHIGKTVPTDDSQCRGNKCENSNNEYRRQSIALGHEGHWTWGWSDSHLQYEQSRNKSREMTIKNTEFKTRLIRDFETHTLTVGGSVNKAKLEDFTSNKASSQTEIDNTQAALFVEDEWRVIEPFSLTLGLRVDHDENYDYHASPRVYGVYQLNSNWVVKGGVATGFRSPQLREIAPNWAQVSRGGNIYGNPDLEPETSVNSEVSINYQGDTGISGSLTAFHNDFEDKITRVACPTSVCTDGPNQFGSDPTYRINVDEAVTQGVEASLFVPVTETVDVSASYTYTDSEQKTGDYKGQPLTQIPQQLAYGEVNWQATERLRPWVSATYRGEEMDPVTGPSSRSNIEPSYTLVDAGMNYQLSDAIELQGAVYNLLDKTREYEDYGYISDERRYWLGLNISF